MQEVLLGTGGKLFYDNSPAAQVLRIERSTAMYIFERASIINPTFSQNALGLYTMVPVGRDGEAVFGSFGTPKYNLRPRAKRCAWNPSTCGINFGIDKIPTCPIQLQNELCTDVLWNSCWEKLLGIGNGIYDWDSTQEAGIMLARVLNKIMQGVGNDFWLLMTFGGHPYIEKANEMKWYRLCGVSEDEWKCFYDMMSACGGHLTMADTLKVVEGLDNFNVEIPLGDVSGDKYVGDTMALFDDLIDHAPSLLARFAKADVTANMPMMVGAANPEGKLIIAVTEGIFNRYKRQLRDQYKNIPESYYMTLHGEAHGCSSCGTRRLRGVLEYDGYLVVCMPEWSELDKMTCVKTHRAILMAPGVLGLAYDVTPDDQFEGMGMQVTKWNMDPHRGKTYISANFRAGAAILDPDYMVMACRFLEPTAA